jgi:dCMP deaminase
MFMKIAQIVAERGTCDRLRVGAVVAHKGRIISIGYNGSPPGEPHCDDVGHLIEKDHCIRTVHTEVNAIQFAMKMLGHEHEQIEVELYVTHLPCQDCCNYIARVNNSDSEIKIRSVVYGDKYPNSVSPAVIASRYDILYSGGVDLIGQLEMYRL